MAYHSTSHYLSAFIWNMFSQVTDWGD